MPNPSSAFCDESGGILGLRASDSGAVKGICVFPDGSECDEWQFLRGTCQPGDSLLPSEETPQEGSQVPGVGWNSWHDEQAGFSFQYPAGSSTTT